MDPTQIWRWDPWGSNGLHPFAFSDQLVNNLTMRSNTRDPEGTRGAILDAAMERFSEYGFDGSSVDAIAADAGVAKSLALYHFRTKRGLWEAVLEQRVKPLLQLVESFFGEVEGGDLEEIVRARFALMQKHPHLPRLLAWMSLDSVSPDPRLRKRVRTLRRRLEATACGVPEGVDPGLFLAVVMASMDGFFRFRGVYARMAGLDLAGPRAEARFLEALVSIAFRREAG